MSVRVYLHPDYRWHGRRSTWLLRGPYFGVEAHLFGRVIELIYVRREWKQRGW